MDELLEEFIAETRDTLEILSGQLVQWEQTPEDSALLDSVFRFVHTVKGSCGFLDLPRLLRLSHAAEELLSRARDGGVSVSAGLVSAVLTVIDRIACLTDALETGQAVYDDDADLIDTMLSYVEPEDAHKVVDKRSKAVAKTLSASSGKKEPLGDFGIKAKSRSVRISLNLIDQLMNGISDMVLARNEVSRQLRRSSANSELEYAFAKLSTSVADMRDAVGQMRMQNIDRLFASLPRLMRDIEQELDKKIELQIEGSEVEVDREMVEALRDPLIHILRNAADHGIENREGRLAAGKSPIGLIRITARQSGNQILVVVTDDGCGINVEKLGSRAVGAKLITSADWRKLPEHEKLHMIFTPGLTTAESVSAISGRGVGMDVVRSNIRAVGGSIDLENYPGQGLKMTLRLPLTLSIIAGLSVRAGNQNFGISRNSVVEILSISNTNVRIEKVGNANIACVREQRYPYARLEDILGIEESITVSEMGRTLVVIRPAVGQVFVLDVANVLDTEELVVKPAAPIVMSSGLYAGTSLPDTGLPILLLDASGLASVIGIELDGQFNGERDYSQISQVNTKTDKRSALLFIGLDGKKQALRFSVIERIEDIYSTNITFVGGKWRMMHEDGLIDIIGIDRQPETEFLKALLLSDGQRRLYYAIDDVVDIFALGGDIEPTIQPELHEGVVMVSGEAIELVNVFPFFETLATISSKQSNRGLCFIECEETDQWERHILAPLLIASGYEVSFENKDKSRAGVVLSKSGAEVSNILNDSKILRIREDMQNDKNDRESIYRYDRIGLLAAIENKLAEAG